MRKTIPDQPMPDVAEDWVETLPAAEARPSPRSDLVSSSACLEPEMAFALVAGRVAAEQQAPMLRHVDRCSSCQERLLQTALNPPPSSQASGHAAARRLVLQPGSVMGQRYFIRCFLDRGGMGEVYEAFDCELRERVALKTVAASLSDSQSAIVRLKAEVQLARRVSHPNVCRVYDLGTNYDAQQASLHFLTMEFVAGTSLAEHLRRTGALDTTTAVRWAIQMLDALSAAHAAGVLHRDFKPGNVMLRGDSEGQLQPVIMDFGLASALNPDSSKLSGSNNSIAGSLAYMAPEQLEGTALDFTTDIYAFGAVLFEMLTGRLAFSAETPAATLARLRRKAPKPSEFTDDIPPALDAVVGRCLARNQEQRFQTASAVKQALLELERPRVPRTSYGARTRQVLVAAGLSCALLGLWFWSTQEQEDAVLPPEKHQVAGGHQADNHDSEPKTPASGVKPLTSPPVAPGSVLSPAESAPATPTTSPPEAVQPKLAAKPGLRRLKKANPEPARAANSSAGENTQVTPEHAKPMLPPAEPPAQKGALEPERACGAGLLCPSAFR